MSKCSTWMQTVLSISGMQAELVGQLQWQLCAGKPNCCDSCWVWAAKNKTTLEWRKFRRTVECSSCSNTKVLFVHLMRHLIVSELQHWFISTSPLLGKLKPEHPALQCFNTNTAVVFSGEKKVLHWWVVVFIFLWLFQRTKVLIRSSCWSFLMECRLYLDQVK